MISHVGQRSPVTAALGASDVGLHGEHKVLDCSGLPLKSGEEATDFEDVSQSDAVRGFVVELASHAPWDGDIKKEKKRFDALRHKISKSYRVISNLDRSVAQRTMNDDRQVFPPISAILRTYNSLVSQGVVKHDPALKSLFIRKEVTPRPLKSRRTFLAAAPRHTKTESSARPNDRRVAPRAPPPRQHRRPPGPRIHAAPCASVPTSLHPRPPRAPSPPFPDWARRPSSKPPPPLSLLAAGATRTRSRSPAQVRSWSGVLVVTVFTAPGAFSCPRDCHYCPNERDANGNQLLPRRRAPPPATRPRRGSRRRCRPPRSPAPPPQHARTRAHTRTLSTAAQSRCVEPRGKASRARAVRTRSCGHVRAAAPSCGRDRNSRRHSVRVRMRAHCARAYAVERGERNCVKNVEGRGEGEKEED